MVRKAVLTEWEWTHYSERDQDLGWAIVRATSWIAEIVMKLNWEQNEEMAS